MEKKFEKMILCECGYYNKMNNVTIYGTCTRCGNILNPKNKFKHEMYNKLKLWRKK